jgi:trigger factor
MPAAALSATVEELPESRVRVQAQVPADELERRIDQVARELGRDMKMPGFRAGKIPSKVVVQRIGRDAVLEEAIRSTIARWYLQAVDETGIHPVGDPDLTLGDQSGPGEPWAFSFEIGVRPEATLGTYKGLEAPRREPVADEEAVEQQLEELRDRMSRLETVDEPVGEGDFILMDYVGTLAGEDEPFEGGTGSDQLIELGSGRLIPGFEDGLSGASAGEERAITVAFPGEYQVEELAGRSASFDVTVKEVRRKQLPELDDQFASDAAGFETLAELREDIAARLREHDERHADAEYREAVLDAAVAQATVTVPNALIAARARDLLERMLHGLEHQGIGRDMYFQMAGKSEEELLEEGADDAERTLRREAVLAAIVEAESLEPSEGDLLDALQAAAAREQTTPEKLRSKLEKAGRLDELVEDLRQRAALELIVEHATAIEPERAAAREQLWTPGDD